MSENKIDRIAKEVHQRRNIHEELIAPVMKHQRRSRRRLKYEESHVRKTIWIRTDFEEIIAKLMAAGEKRSDIINEALEEYFEKYKHELSFIEYDD